MQYLVNLHPSRKPGTSSGVWYSGQRRSRNDEMSTSDTKLPSHRGPLLAENAICSRSSAA
eukprot:2688278-Pleurochrysis_carterae.AAC.1